MSHVLRIEVIHDDALTLDQVHELEVRVLCKGDPRLLGHALGEASANGKPEVQEILLLAAKTAARMVGEKLETEWLKTPQKSIN